MPIYATVVEGLDDGAGRDRLAAKLQRGTSLELTPIDTGVVAVIYAGREIGHLPARLRPVAEALARGCDAHCQVIAIETAGLLRRRARRVEIEIEVIEKPSTIVEAAKRLAEASGKALGSAGNTSIDGARWLGQAAADGTGAVTRAASSGAVALGRTAAQVADVAVVRPATYVIQNRPRPIRTLKRIVIFGVISTVLILTLVLLILILLRWQVGGLGSLIGAVTR
ncbi:MAG: hypothetical protein FJX62_09175 [Alphaproteobacteria bacterium]|nr:hypothetical protein [Alphaproteobacteria bacterium]